MKRHPSNEIAAASAADPVERAFQRDGWKLQEQVELRGRRADFIISNGSLRYAIEVKEQPKDNSAPLEDSWSPACLQARFYADVDRRSGSAYLNRIWT